MLVDLAYKMKYFLFIRELLGYIDGYDQVEEELVVTINSKKEDYPLPLINIINSCLFVVNDINLFVDSVRKRGYCIH